MKKFLILFLFFITLQNIATATVAKSDEIKSTNLTVFKVDNDFGLKDKHGNIVVEAQYKKLIRLGTNGWIVQKGNRFGIIDCQGNILVKPKYRHVERLFEKYVKLGNNNDYGIYDEYGKAIIPAEYSSIDPLYGRIFLTCKKYKYGIVDFDGTIVLDNIFDDIYMPNFSTIRVMYEGEWYEIEKLKDTDINLPENVKKVIINENEFKVTHLVSNTGIMSGYSAVTTADYILKTVSTISPAYEQTIDDLMLSQGADTVSIFMKLSWIPKFPATYAKKYYQLYRNPNNGPLVGIKNILKRKIK